MAVKGSKFAKGQGMRGYYSNVHSTILLLIKVAPRKATESIY